MLRVQPEAVIAQPAEISLGYGKGRGFDALWRLHLTSIAPVAQLAEAADSNPVQCRFEACPAHQSFSLPSPSGPRHRSYKPIFPRFESWREYQCARSSVEEPRADNAETEVRFFTGTPLLQNWREK